MAIPAVEVYQVLEEPLGAEGAKVLVEFVETSVRERAVTKEDLWSVEKRLSECITQGDQALSERITQVEKGLSERIAQVERSLSDHITRLEWRMKVYLILIGALIVVTNPKVLDLIGKVLALGK